MTHAEVQATLATEIFCAKIAALHFQHSKTLVVILLAIYNFLVQVLQ